MARDGSGNWVAPAGQPVVNGTVIDETVFNTLVTDIGVSLSASIAKDGQTAASADLPMGTNKHTNCGDAAARNQYGTAGQIQDNDFNVLSSVSGTNTIVGSLAPAITGYSAGMHVTLVPANNNTGAATIAINGLTALDILKAGGEALASDDLVAGVPAYLICDGDDFYLQNPITNITGVSGSFTGTLTGVSGTVTQTIYYVRALDLVSLFMAQGDQLVGTSNATTMTLTGKPAALRPSSTRIIATMSQDNGQANQAAMALVQGTGDTVLFFIGAVSGTRMTYSSTSWTSSGTKGLDAGWTITYPL